MFLDNRYVEGSSTPLSRTDAGGDSFQLRKLQDGSLYEVLKNFPAAEELKLAMAGRATAVEVTLLDYHWILSYRTK